MLVTSPSVFGPLLLLRWITTTNLIYYLDYVIPLFTQLFLFQSTNGDFAAVPSEVNSEERYICDQMALVTCVLQ